MVNAHIEDNTVLLDVCEEDELMLKGHFLTHDR